ncbi:hypothetical protein FRC02_007134 [Tulasnella sp. 418]|nr:hypothetical protein FRC02_007134 [Tulasnella sp. 418]
MGSFMDGSLELPTHMPPEVYAMEKAVVGCGGSVPKADKRYTVESIWMSIQIRQAMGKIADMWTEMMEKRGGLKDSLSSWMNFVVFLHESILHDAEVAGRIASEAQSYRQVIKSALIRETTRYELFLKEYALARLSPLTADKTTELEGKVQDCLTKTKLLLATIKREFGNALGRQMRDQAWLDENFVRPLNTVIDAWSALKLKIRGPFYQEVSVTEMEQIARALRSGREGYEFGENKTSCNSDLLIQGYSIANRGHAYQCPNGHTYFIGDVSPNSPYDVMHLLK